MMLKQLLKKQLLEMFQNFFVDRKKNKGRSKASSIAMIVGYFVLICGLFGAMFSVFAYSMLPIVDRGYGWMFFCFMGIVAVAMGAFGSIFNTYSGLYLAKDNDFLISMPIPVGYIMASRLLGVYLMGTLYSALVIIPAIIVYLLHVPFSAKALICAILFVIIISLIVMILSCALGWVVAKINSKLKNKSIMTVFVSLVFLAIYYVFYFKANEIIRSIIANADAYGDKIKGSVYPLYFFGRAGAGDIVASLIVLVIVGAFCALTYYVIARSFIGIATATQNVSKKRYTEKRVKTKSADFALLGKELQRFLSSPNYILNCGLGILILIGAGVLVLIKGSWLLSGITNIFGSDNFVCVIASALICLIASMNDMSAPSISLEGKNIWIAQSLPVTSWQAIKAKRNCHLLLTCVPTLICSICAVIALKPTVLGAAMMVVMPLVFVLLFSVIGLALNLKYPNLKWTNEITPIKQSMSVFVSMFGGWIYSILIMFAYYPLSGIISSEIYLIGAAAVTGLLCLAIHSWLKKKGTKIFAEL